MVYVQATFVLSRVQWQIKYIFRSRIVICKGWDHSAPKLKRSTTVFTYRNLPEVHTTFFCVILHPWSLVAEVAEQFACQPHIIAIFFSFYTKETNQSKNIFCVSLNYKKKKGPTLLLGVINFESQGENVLLHNGYKVSIQNPRDPLKIYLIFSYPFWKLNIDNYRTHKKLKTVSRPSVIKNVLVWIRLRSKTNRMDVHCTYIISLHIYYYVSYFIETNIVVTWFSINMYLYINITIIFLFIILFIITNWLMQLWSWEMPWPITSKQETQERLF